eukprot:Skav207686  [mRNA]  locus=scaffold1757:17504:22504:+ [translate_table: standard]
MSDFKLAVDESNKATELPLLRVCGTVQQNPHMRAFWAATISFFLAFLGWFALAPLGLEVATSMGTCENQLYPPESSPTRVAYLKYKNISTTETYCQYGQVKAEDGTLTDCEEVPAGIASSPTATAEEKMKYRPQVLAKCVCTTGTECNGIIANAGVAADTPTAKRFDVSVTGKTKKPSLWDYVEVLKDVRVVVMIFQYSACFGTELAMNNQLATHFRTYFQLPAADASALAGAFGLMNLFARSLGGISSDVLFKYVGFRGRIWAQFLALSFEAIFLFGFGLVDNSQPWYVALAVLVCFSLFVQMAEGTSYGIVPFMNKQELAIVSALVGAGGNLGAVIAGFCFYKAIDDPLIPFQVHAGYVMFWALLTPLYYWKEHGGMFHGPAEPAKDKIQEKSQPEGAETEIRV